jgi:putative sterol carrier protein
VSVYAKLKKMVDLPLKIEDFPQKELDLSIESFGRHLAEATGKDVGRISINIYDGNCVSSYCLDLIGNECRVSQQRAEDSRFEINIKKETWLEISSGQLAPVDAFLMGRMAVLGDLAFGRRLYAKLAVRDGKTDF